MVAVVVCTPPVVDPIARYSSRIAIFAYSTRFDAPFGGPYPIIATMFGMELHYITFFNVA